MKSKLLLLGIQYVSLSIIDNFYVLDTNINNTKGYTNEQVQSQVLCNIHRYIPQ